MTQFNQTIPLFRYFNPSIELAPWGAKLMKLTDPFGNKILFNEKQA